MTRLGEVTEDHFVKLRNPFLLLMCHVLSRKDVSLKHNICNEDKRTEVYITSFLLPQ